MKLGSCVFCLCLMNVTYGQVILVDDFNDGADDGWTHLDFLSEAAGPGLFDARSGAYNLSSTAKIAPTGGTGLASAWDASSDPLYSNGFLRAKVRAETDGTSVFLLMRGRTSGDAYSFHASTSVGFQIRRLTGFESALLAQLDPIDYAFAAGEEWMMEAGAVNDRLSLKVWRAGTDEPTTSQLTTFDTAYATGLFGVDVGTFPRHEVRISGTFDDIFFIPAPELGDFDSDGVLTVLDINVLTEALRHPPVDAKYDVNRDGMVNLHDREYWVTELKQTWFGDANFDGEFSSSDLVAVFQAGQYEDVVDGNSDWGTGDWDADGDFASGDLVLAFQDGGFEQGPRPAARAVPEPSGSVLILLVLGAAHRRSRNDLRNTAYMRQDTRRG